MNLFCDEDIGTRVPRALQRVGLRVQWVVQRYNPGHRGQVITDVRWLTDAGRNGWLAFSSNTDMLNVQEERETIINEKVGIVFLTSGQERLPDMLRLLLNKWAWLEAIDQQITRPFVYTLTIKGRSARVDPIAPLRRGGRPR